MSDFSSIKNLFHNNQTNGFEPEDKIITNLNYQDIIKILPHRYPMLLVDRVIEMVLKKRIVAIKNVTSNEPFFNGHFPGMPVMPGVLMIEAMAQAAGILAIKSFNDSEKPASVYLLSVEEAKFRQVVLPGDTLTINAELLKVRESSKTCTFKCETLVDGKRVSEARIMAIIKS